MEAIKFLKEYIRMCNCYEKCSECPVFKVKNDMHCFDFRDTYPEKFVEIVSKWSIDNQPITNRGKFLEVFGITFYDAITTPDWADNEYKENK